MPSAEERAHIEQLLKIHRRSLAILEEQVAVFGGEISAPLHIIHDIDSRREEIRKLESRLADHSTPTK